MSILCLKSADMVMWGFVYYVGRACLGLHKSRDNRLFV